MNIKVTKNFSVQKVLNARGMGMSNGLRKYLAARVKARCDPYVPYQQGILKDTSHISQDGTEIVYNQPYAHYQYEGKVMGPNVLTKKGWRSMAGKGEKYYTGKTLTYNHAPMRGDHWDKRMMADHAGDVEKDVAAYLGGKRK